MRQSSGEAKRVMQPVTPSVRHRRCLTNLDLGSTTTRSSLLQSAEHVIKSCNVTSTRSVSTLRLVEADIRSTFAAIQAVGKKDVWQFSPSRKKLLEEDRHVSRLAVARMMEKNRRQLKRARYDLA